MKRHLITLAILAFIAILGILIEIVPGTVAITFKDHGGSYGLPLWLSVIAFLFVFILCHGIWRIFDRLDYMIQTRRLKQHVEQIEQSQRWYQEGLIAKIEGQLKVAEHLMNRSAKHSSTPFVQYFTGAEIARALGEKKEARRYLALAKESSPEASAAIAIIETQWDTQGQ